MLEAKVDRMQASIDAVLEKLDSNSKSSLMPTMPTMGQMPKIESMTALSPRQFLRKTDPAEGDGDPERGGGGMFAGLSGFSSGISSGIPFAGAFGVKATSRDSLPHFGEWEAQGGAKTVGDGEQPKSISARAGLETSERPHALLATSGRTLSKF
jgi:hypothetical protein